MKRKTNVGRRRRREVGDVEEEWACNTGFGMGHELHGTSMDLNDMV